MLQQKKKIKYIAILNLKKFGGNNKRGYNFLLILYARYEPPIITKKEPAAIVKADSITVYKSIKALRGYFK